MAKKYDVVVTIGSYEKEGQKKYINRNVGSIIQTQHGFRLKLDASFNPAGCPRDEDGAVWLALFEPKPRDNQQNQGGGMNQEPAFDPSDDIPFNIPQCYREVVL